MQRVQIDFPETTLFTYQFTIVEEDINIANHVGNERILVLANHSREKMFEHLNLKLYDLNELHGIVVANHTINYKSEGFLNDIITCYGSIDTLTECSFDLLFHFKKENGKTLAMLRTGCIYYDFQTRKIKALPESYNIVFNK
ncbi:MAG TPA: thioesterase family protein [Chitinophagales bacterium]|jgi:acyl-CoA thioester hydrolase|nr:thioesterase family protein [Chitinophagales bacterium]MBP6154660.1 thioesterase family protein [Chitinophagales bacterium]HQV79008.1 thioesterase family protein [Chitinophagales bacterium]HQW79950.1 thioesterase family protein [Chitinophagales bacterium]